jgi:3-hydroxyacyl-CoA dehydrogenase/enoyl-CoA hydratase/3-hydroxybutyryl-CoA epimerase
VIDRIIDDFDRKGRSTDGAFYSDDDNTSGPPVGDDGTADIPFNNIEKRTLFSETLKTQRWHRRRAPSSAPPTPTLARSSG